MHIEQKCWISHEYLCVAYETINRICIFTLECGLHGWYEIVEEGAEKMDLWSGWFGRFILQREAEKTRSLFFQGCLLRLDLILVYKILHSKCAIGVDEIFMLNEASSTRGHPFKLFKPRSQSECRKRFFLLRVSDQCFELYYIILLLLKV